MSVAAKWPPLIQSVLRTDYSSWLASRDRNWAQSPAPSGWA